MREKRSLERGWVVTMATLVLVLGLMGCLPEPGVDPETREIETPTESLVQPEPSVVPTLDPGALTTYRNDEYGFSFRYPPEWDVTEGRSFISLGYGSINLVVGYRHVSEEPNICCREHLPQAELVDAGTVECAGEEITKALLQCGEKTKAVVYQGTEEIGVGDLRFLFYLEDFSVDYDLADISENVQLEVDRLIRSVEIFEVADGLAATTPTPTEPAETPEPTPVTPTPAQETPTPEPALAEAGPGSALVRSGPGPAYDVEGSLQPGEQAEITGRYINWWRIIYEGSPAWVYDDVVRTSNTEEVPVVRPEWTPEPDPETPTPAAATPDADTPTASTAVAEARPGGANVRSGPGLRFALEGFLDGGEHAEIIGRHGNWWQILYDGSPAWVYGGVVRVTGTEHVPVVETVPTPVPRSPAVIPTAAPPEAIDEERWIDVSLSEQRLRAYENDEVVRTSLVSTGLPHTPTPPGQFRIWIKLRYDDMSGPGYHYPNVPYVMYYYRGYGIHGTYWHDNFGQPMSAGCVNLPVEEAAWVYDFVDVGTLVNVRP